MESHIITKVAEHYIRSSGQSFPDLHDFQCWIVESYLRLPVRVEFVDHNPYGSLEEMTLEVISTDIMKITSRNNKSVFDPSINLMFRAVHDYDHIRSSANFGIWGEQEACRTILSRCADEWGRALLFSEIVGQACVRVTKGEFEPQKFVLFPADLRNKFLDLIIHIPKVAS